MRKSFDGLYALVRTGLHKDALCGDLYGLINRRGTQIKVLYFDRSGWCLWSNQVSSYCTSFSWKRRFTSSRI
jgi:transposase